MNRKQIYFLDKTIYFFSDEKNFMYLNEDLFFISKSENSKKMWDDFKLFMQQNDYSQLVFFGKKYKKHFSSFMQQFVMITAAGGLIKNELNEYLFIFRNGKWDLPKGKVEPNEQIKQAAVRECKEECGIHEIKTGRKFSETYHMYELEQKIIFKITHWYHLRVSSEVRLVPQAEEGIEAIRWFKISELAEVKKNTYPNILDLITEAGIS